MIVFTLCLLLTSEIYAWSGNLPTSEPTVARNLRSLYPPINASSTGILRVDETHELYYEHYGRDLNSAKTALFLHGGPGAACFPRHARFFSPRHYSIILLDQRGCGKSTPTGETTANNLPLLVNDCESLRLHLDIPKWDLILGGSWGTTLAIAYAQRWPDRVGGMVLRGVCLFRQKEIDWLFARNGGARSLNPQGWKEFEQAVGIVEASDTDHREALHRYYDCLLGPDPITRLCAIKSWMKWEMSIFGWKKEKDEIGDEILASHLVWDVALRGWSFQDDLGPFDGGETDQLAAERAHQLRRLPTLREQHLSSVTNMETEFTIRPLNHATRDVINAKLPPNVTLGQAQEFVPAQAMLTCFYSVNDKYVVHPYTLLDDVDRIRSIKCISIQGGSDTICPPDSALDLLEVWPEMELRIPIKAGHSMYDPEICSEIVKATDRFAGMRS